MTELKSVLGYENEYTVNHDGVIVSAVRHGTLGGIMKPFLTSYGYMRVALTKNRKTKFMFIHKIVAHSFILNPYNKPFINHKNGIKTDNRIENLEWCTASENSQHAYDNGLRSAHPKKGESNHNAKLKEIQVLKIRESKLSQSALSKKYGVSKGVIQRIKQRLTWNHI